MLSLHDDSSQFRGRRLRMFSVSKGDVAFCLAVAVVGSLAETVSLLYPLRIWLGY